MNELQRILPGLKVFLSTRNAPVSLDDGGLVLGAHGGRDHVDLLDGGGQLLRHVIRRHRLQQRVHVLHRALDQAALRQVHLQQHPLRVCLHRARQREHFNNADVWVMTQGLTKCQTLCQKHKQHRQRTQLRHDALGVNIKHPSAPSVFRPIHSFISASIPSRIRHSQGSF